MKELESLAIPIIGFLEKEEFRVSRSEFCTKGLREKGKLDARTKEKLQTHYQI